MKVTKLLIVADSFNIFASGMFGPIFAIYVNSIDGGLVAIGSSITIMALFSATCLYVVSRYADRIRNWKRLLIISYLLFSIVYFSYIFADSVFLLFVIQAVAGVAYSIGTPVYKGMYSKNTDPNIEAKEWGNLDVVNQLVIGISAFIGSILVSYMGFYLLFIVMGILALISAIVIHWKLEKSF